MMPSFKKTVHLKGDDIVELSTENKTLKIKSSYDEKMHAKIKPNLVKNLNDEKRAAMIMSRKRKPAIQTRYIN